MTMKKQIFTIAILLATCAHATYLQAATITIGGKTKNTIGTIVEVTQGDISCYFQLKDDTGKPFNESASFDLCEKSFEGRRVQLGYSIETVQAAACQGNPDCKKTERIALVTSVKPLGKTAPAAAKPLSFCTPAETVVFACQTGVKLVSVCASNNLSPKAGYLQYRFGSLGQPLEMAFPASEAHPLKAGNGIYGANETYAGGGASWLRFRKGAYAYVVYTGIGRWGKNGATMEKAGLAVENNGKVISNLKCSGKITSELGPQWYDKVGYQRSDKEEFFIPD